MTSISITPLLLIAIACGGALGALCRFFVQQLAGVYWGTDFPYGTLLVNMLGCLILGMLAAYWLGANSSISEPMRAAIVIGFLGSFTTFSAFSLDTLALFQQGDMLRALINVMANVIFSLFAVFTGYHTATRLIS
jgi:fluoride exporter